MIFVSENHSWQALYIYEIDNFPFPYFFLVALSNLNQPTLSDRGATVMVQNTLQLSNDYPMQEGNIYNRPLAASTNCNLISPPNIAMADTGRSKSGYMRPSIDSSILIKIS